MAAGEEVNDGRYANVFTVSTLKLIKKKTKHAFKDIYLLNFTFF